jgi:hypothetical protein
LSDQFSLCTAPIRVTDTSAPQRQPLSQALDVSEYDAADVLVHVLTLTGTSPSVTVKLLTAMQADTEDGWCTLATFTAITGSNQCELLRATGPLRYIRWEVTLTGTGSPEVWFTLGGMLRESA